MRFVLSRLTIFTIDLALAIIIITATIYFISNFAGEIMSV